MSQKKKEQFRKMGADYFEAERELVQKGEYEAGPVRTKWLAPACIIMCVATFWSVNRLLQYIEPGENYTVIFAIFAGGLIVGVTVYNLITYALLRFVAKVPADRLIIYRRFIRLETGCKNIIKKNDYLLAEIVPFVLFVAVPIVLEFVYTNGWFLCFGIVMCACQMMNVFYMFEIGFADEKSVVGVIPGSGELRVYRLKSTIKKRR